MIKNTMYIVLDTNVLVRDFKFHSKTYQALIKFMDAKGGSFLIPDIVIDEAVACYRRDCEKNLLKIKDAAKKLSRLSLENNEISFDYFDLNRELGLYRKLLLNPGTRLKSTIISNNPSHMKETTRRLIEGIKPASQTKRNEFRDVLIWLCIKDYLQTNLGGEKVIFISENKSEFSDGNESLCNELKKEIQTASTPFEYFTSVENFLKSNSEHEDFIDAEWLSKKLDKALVESIVFDKLENYKELDSLIREQTGLWFEGNAKFLSLDFYIEDFFVLSFSENKAYLNIKLDASIEIGVDLLDSSLVFPHYVNQHQSLTAKIYLSATVSDEELEAIEIDKFELID